MFDLKTMKCLLLDLDGTVYLDGVPIGDMTGTLDFLRNKGIKLIFLTNNSSKTESDYIARLNRAGLYSQEDSVLTSGAAAIDYILNNRKGKSAYVLGTESLRRQFAASGITLTDHSPDIAVLGYDTEIDYRKICEFAAALRGGAEYIATHPDTNCPSLGGPLPDAGSFSTMFHTSTGRLPETIIGKPNTFMGDAVMHKFGFSRNEIMMAGDRLYTDIKFALNCGFGSLLVFSGETTREEYEKSDVRADIALDSLNALKKLLL